MEKRNIAEVEKELMNHFSASNMSKDHLSSISKSIAGAYISGLKVIDWSIYGTPPFEHMVIQTQVPISELNAVQGLLGNERFKEIRVFRKGIPIPQFFQVDLTVNNVVKR